MRREMRTACGGPATPLSVRLSGALTRSPQSNKGARRAGACAADVGLFATIRDYVDGLVHPSAQQDALSASRHRAFIAPRLIGSLVALAAFPVYLALRGVPSVLEVIVFAWLVAPILIAYFLSRTGQYESAHVLSSLALTGLVTAVAIETGGIGSFAAIWLVVVPLEAALSASRRVVALASTFALGAAGFLLLMGALDLLPAAAETAPGAGGARRARHHLGRALRHRACARRRVARAHQLLAALSPRRTATGCSPAT